MTGRAWRARPSELLGVTEVRLALMVDEAVALFGSRLESRMDEAAAKAKDPAAAEAAVKRVLSEALNGGEPARPPVRPPARRYRYEMTPGGVPRPIPVGRAA